MKQYVISFFCLFFMLLASACTSFGNNSEIAVQSSSPAAPEIIPIKEPEANAKKANDWKELFATKLGGRNYQFTSRDISPDGYWFAYLNPSTFVLTLTPLDNLSNHIESKIESPGALEMVIYNWASDGSAMLVCVNQNHNPNGCQALLVLEISHEGKIVKHTISWSGKTFTMLWGKGYILLFEPSSGIYKYSYDGELMNQSNLTGIVDVAWTNPEQSEEFLAMQNLVGPAKNVVETSILYEIQVKDLQETEIFRTESWFRLLGKDGDAHYCVLEELSADSSHQPKAISIFDLKTRVVSASHKLPTGINLIGYESPAGQIALNLWKNGHDREEATVWMVDFGSLAIEDWGTGQILGWLNPDKGFLVRDQKGNWTLLR